MKKNQNGFVAKYILIIFTSPVFNLMACLCGLGIVIVIIGKLMNNEWLIKHGLWPVFAYFGFLILWIVSLSLYLLISKIIGMFK